MYVYRVLQTLLIFRVSGEGGQKILGASQRGEGEKILTDREGGQTILDFDFLIIKKNKGAHIKSFA